MMTLRKIAFAAAVALGVAGSESTAQAQCSGPMCNQARYNTLGQFLGAGRGPMPTYQAAPWYLYWPYDAHFQTPAPVTGAWYGPPNCRAPLNPYFPPPAGFGAYGPPPGYGYPPPAGYAAPGGPGNAPPPPAGFPIPAGYAVPQR